MNGRMYSAICPRGERLFGSGLALASLALLGAALPAGATEPAAPTPGAFQAVGPMTISRFSPTLTLLADGSVLVTGGTSPRAADGMSNLVELASTERFDPKTNLFVAGSPLTVARSGHMAAPLPDGKVLVFGGLDAKNHVLASAEVYDPATGTFTAVGSMSQARWNGTATPLLDGRVLVVGGRATFDSGAVISTAELFDPASGTFQKTGSLAAARTDHAAVRLADGRVAILGGGRGSRIDQRSVEIYDPTTGVFSTQGEIVTARVTSAFLVPGDKILLAGGIGGTPPTTGPQAGNYPTLDSIEVYDPATGQSTQTGHLSQARLAAAVGLADGRILEAGDVPAVLGGADDAATTAELIDPVTGLASPAAALVGPRGLAASILLPDHRALILGGVDASGRYLNTAEVFVP
jgi:hypothetical protein